METDKSDISEKILSLTLEIIYLLTGEDYIIVKNPKGQTQNYSRSRVVEGICRTGGKASLTPQEDNELKILDLTHKMLKLLSSEVPIRCQDVAVYLSMEEWEYIEGHRDLYQDVLKGNNQNTGLPEDMIWENDLPPPVASEDDMSMDTDAEIPGAAHTTVGETMSERMTRSENGNLSDVSPAHHCSVQIKEEPWDEENTASHSAADIHSVHIKEESASYDGENLTDSNIPSPSDHPQHPYPHNGGEPVSCHGQNFSHPNIYTATGPSSLVHHPPAEIMEEPSSGDRGNLTHPNIYTAPGPSQPLSILNMEEPSSADRGNLTHPNIYMAPGPSLPLSTLSMEETTSSAERSNLAHPNIYTAPGPSLPLSTLSMEEPSSADRSNLTHPNTYTAPRPSQPLSTLSMEEPSSADRSNLTHPNSYTAPGPSQPLSTLSMEEPCSVDRSNLTHPNIYMAPGPSLPLSTLSMEEPSSADRSNLTHPNSYTAPGPSLPLSTLSMEETSSGERGNLTHPNIYTPTGPSQPLSTETMEEPYSGDRDNLTQPNICSPTAHRNQHTPPPMEEPMSSIKKELDTKLDTQQVPISMKEKSASHEDLLETKTCGFPTRPSKSTPGKKKEPASSSGRKLSVASAKVWQPTSNDDNETNRSSSVYSVHESDNAMKILYHCPSCHKGFYSNLELARHQVIHTVDKLFICSVCGKRFTEMSFAIKHQVIHTDLKLCVCQVCGGCFYSEASLAKHQRSHPLPGYCSICGMSFINDKELEIHKRRHSPNQLHPCHVCGRKFIAKSALGRHMIVHKKPAK